MKRALPALAIILGIASADEPVSFRKIVLTEYYFADGIDHGDVNRDGHEDVVAGPFSYQGPDFKEAHAFYEPRPLPPALSPSDSMFSYVHDIDGDGWLDILKLGRIHKHEAVWFQNPAAAAGGGGLWKKRLVADRVKGESPPFLDVNGDGRSELVTHWESNWGFLNPPDDPTKPWTRTAITRAGEWKQFYHGTGIGDVNGDDRQDLVLNEGWFEQPATAGAEWIEHPFQFGEKGGAQIGVFDVDGDGDNDIVTSLDGHGWGLAWFQNSGGSFTKYMIMGSREEEPKYGVAFSQVHALDFADINGDGLTDIITGKRRWAHGPEGDVEPIAAPVLYWFELARDDSGARFLPHLIDDQSGVGTQVTAADVNGDEKVDVLTVSKLGTFVFLQN